MRSIFLDLKSIINNKLKKIDSTHSNLNQDDKKSLSFKEGEYC